MVPRGAGITGVYRQYLGGFKLELIKKIQIGNWVLAPCEDNICTLSDGRVLVYFNQFEVVETEEEVELRFLYEEWQVASMGVSYEEIEAYNLYEFLRGGKDLKQGGDIKYRLTRPDIIVMKGEVGEHSSKRLLTEGDLSFLGSFTFPDVKGQKSRFQYGGYTLAHYRREERGLGSLFTMGHSHHLLVSEVGVPERLSSDRDNLVQAQQLQEFTDVTGGLRSQLDAATPVWIGGMTVVGSEYLHWTVYEYYNGDGKNHFSHGASNLGLSSLDATGLWHLGPVKSREHVWHSYKHAGYVFEIPDYYKGKAKGKNLVCGMQARNTREVGSIGPSFYAYNLPTRYLSGGCYIEEAIPLVVYLIGEFPEHTYADWWADGCWVWTKEFHGIVVVGRHGLGEYYYGPGRPDAPNKAKGGHAHPYQAQMLFYNPDEVFDVSEGVKGLGKKVPYQRVALTNNVLYFSAEQYLTGVAYDPVWQHLFVLQYGCFKYANDFEYRPVVHMFKVGR